MFFIIVQKSLLSFEIKFSFTASATSVYVIRSGNTVRFPELVILAEQLRNRLM